jgi:hypothetical protein
MALESIDLLNGSFSVIFVIISTIVGIRTVLKYFESKNRTLLWVGFSWILIVAPWWPSSLSFIVALFTGQGLTLSTYLLIGNIPAPLFVLFLVGAFTEVYFHEKQKIILLILVVIGILVEIYIIYYVLISNMPSELGTLQGIVDIEFRGFLRYYLLSVIVLVLILGCAIAYNSIKSDAPEIKLRGKFLLVAFISWTIGAICDAVVPLTFITLPIIRILLISSAIEFYCGFVLPGFIRKAFLKES